MQHHAHCDGVILKNRQFSIFMYMLQYKKHKNRVRNFMEFVSKQIWTQLQ